MTPPRQDTGPICIIDAQEDLNSTVAAGPIQPTHGGVDDWAPPRSKPPRRDWHDPLADAYALMLENDIVAPATLLEYHSELVRILLDCGRDVNRSISGAASVMKVLLEDMALGSHLKTIVAEQCLRDLRMMATVSARSPRRQLLVAAQPAIVDKVRSALENSKADWRTPSSLAKELEVSDPEVRRALESMGDEIRRPIAARGDELNYFRLATRGKTWQERLRWALLALGRTPPDKIR